jgi:ubiquinone/menaquinone biosynthesis C-methylase UbiE
MSFDHIAPFYRVMEFLSAGGKLQRCRVAFLDVIPAPQTILLAGEGHGRFLPECVRKFPEAQITVIDASERMLEISRSRITAKNVTFLHADLLTWQAPAGGYDLIVTHFFLDCFTPEELPLVIRKLARAGTANASWLIADFQIAHSGLARWRSRMILKLLYRFFSVVSRLRAQELIAPDALLGDAGYRLKERKVFEWGLLKSDWWTADNSKAPFSE